MQEPDGEIGDLLGQDVGRVRDDDAAPAGLGGVDGVVADAEIGDDLELRQLVHEGAVDVVMAAGGKAADARRELGDERIPVGRFPGLVQVEGLPDALHDEGHHRAQHQHFDVLQGSDLRGLRRKAEARPGPRRVCRLNCTASSVNDGRQTKTRQAPNGRPKLVGTEHALGKSGS